MKVYLAVFLSIVVISLFLVFEEKKVVTIKTPVKSQDSVVHDAEHIPQAKIEKKEALLVPKDIKKSEIENRYIDSQEILEKNTLSEEVDIHMPYDTAEKMDEHIAETYDALISDGYEETMGEAEEAFEALDDHIAQVSTHLEAERDMEIEFSEQLSIEEEISIEDNEEEINHMEETEMLPVAEDATEA